jgi:nitrite reductase (NADH) large subunit
LIATGGEVVGLAALPDDAEICSCNGVSKGSICWAIAEGACTVADIKKCTTAGTTCGGCVPSITKLLADSGVELEVVVRALHPDRAELFSIVAATGIRSFSELLTRFGTGAVRDLQADRRLHPGVDVQRSHPRRRDGRAAGHQRPLPGQPAAQRHLLVVPRMPGGEVTPDS